MNNAHTMVLCWIKEKMRLTEPNNSAKAIPVVILHSSYEYFMNIYFIAIRTNQLLALILGNPLTTWASPQKSNFHLFSSLGCEDFQGRQKGRSWLCVLCTVTSGGVDLLCGRRLGPLLFQLQDGEAAQNADRKLCLPLIIQVTLI